jgi:outer membrane immunogenic protein
MTWCGATPRNANVGPTASSLRSFGLGSVAFLTLVASPALAVDMRLVGWQAGGIPQDSGWTGFYVGGQIGGKTVTDDWNTTCVDAGGPPKGTCGSTINLGKFPGAPDATATKTFNHTNGRYGGYLGAQLQYNPVLVFGVEADAAFFNQSSTVPGLLGCSTLTCTSAPPPTLDLSGDFTRVTSGSDSSIRFRLGYLLTPAVMAYLAGGAAFQKVEATMACNGATSPACTFSHLDSQSEWLSGYTIGGGAEWKLLPNWLIRGEYRFSDFGTLSHTFFRFSRDVEVLANVKVRSQMATAGVAYLFPIHP